MNEKEQAFKMIEGRIESIQKLSLECIEFIYLAAYNEAIEEAAKCCENLNRSQPFAANEIRKLKK